MGRLLSRLGLVVVLAVLSGLAYSQAATASAGDGAVPSPERLIGTSPLETAADDNPTSLAPDLPPLPRGKVTLIGGTIGSVDHLRDQIIIRVFGSGNMRVFFDERTEVYRDGQKASTGILESGERIYADTMLDGTKVFARSLRISSSSPGGETSGQVLNYDPVRGELKLRDALSRGPVVLRVDSETEILAGDRTVAADQLPPGTLVAVVFRPEAGKSAVVRRVSILASPGSSFTFVGRVAHLDLHLGLLALVDPRDQKRYDISFDPATVRVSSNLREGVEATVAARFDGTRYSATAITLSTAPRK